MARERLAYYKAYPRDFIEGTIGMPFEVKCAYRVVIDLIYMQSGKLPDDARYISGLLGCSVRKWNSIRTELINSNKLQVIGEFLTNYRAVSELETLSKYQDKQAENASDLNKNKDLQNRSLNHSRDKTEPINKKELDKSNSKKSNKKKYGNPRQELEKVLSPEHADAVIEHRQRLRKPLSGYAAYLLANKLNKAHSPNAAADVMINRGWIGFEVEWLNKSEFQSPKRTLAQVAMDRVRDENERNANEQEQANSGADFLISYAKQSRA